MGRVAIAGGGRLALHLSLSMLLLAPVFLALFLRVLFGLVIKSLSPRSGGRAGALVGTDRLFWRFRPLVALLLGSHEWWGWLHHPLAIEKRREGLRGVCLVRTGGGACVRGVCDWHPLTGCPPSATVIMASVQG